ncbi:MAG: hypothetical protein U5J97_11275 [Trueperaceae bacterium]|nr:hypothetical protein [Trueperaceae bacterium]
MSIERAALGQRFWRVVRDRGLERPRLEREAQRAVVGAPGVAGAGGGEEAPAGRGDGDRGQRGIVRGGEDRGVLGLGDRQVGKVGQGNLDSDTVRTHQIGQAVCGLVAGDLRGAEPLLRAGDLERRALRLAFAGRTASDTNLRRVGGLARQRQAGFGQADTLLGDLQAGCGLERGGFELGPGVA